MAATRIKICGITREADAEMVAAAGADAIGLVFYPASPRAVSVDQAARIAAHLPPFVTLVGLFVDADRALVDEVLNRVPLGLIQFHGDEPADYCASFQRPWIKALRVRPGLDIDAACAPFRQARGVLLDTWREGVPGGTGETFDWRLASARLPLPLVLAGGLHEDNVGSAIASVRPAAVDVSGGVESAPGIKDAARVGRFIAAVRRADRDKQRMSHEQ